MRPVLEDADAKRARYAALGAEHARDGQPCIAWTMPADYSHNYRAGYRNALLAMGITPRTAERWGTNAKRETI